MTVKSASRVKQYVLKFSNNFQNFHITLWQQAHIKGKLFKKQSVCSCLTKHFKDDKFSSADLNLVESIQNQNSETCIQN